MIAPLTWRLLLISLVTSSLGCAYCASPYDYCGPTFTGHGEDCNPHGRFGSTLSGPLLYRQTGYGEYLPDSAEEIGPYQRPTDAQTEDAPYEELPEPTPFNEDLLPEPRLEDTIPDRPGELPPLFRDTKQPRPIRLRR